jgi:hypothetical protein
MANAQFQNAIENKEHRLKYKDGDTERILEGKPLGKWPFERGRMVL